MITATREERTGRDLMDPHDFATIVTKIGDTYRVAPYDASIALDQAIATVMTVVAVSVVRRENLWLSVPVDHALQVWRTNPLQYGNFATIAGAYVDRVPMMDPAGPDRLIRTAEVIQEQGFMLHREAWHGQPGARAIALVATRLVAPASA